MNTVYYWAKHYTINLFHFVYNFLILIWYNLSYICSLLFHIWIFFLQIPKAPKNSSPFKLMYDENYFDNLSVVFTLSWSQRPESPLTSYSSLTYLLSTPFAQLSSCACFFIILKVPSPLLALVLYLHLHFPHYFSTLRLPHSHKTNATYFRFLLWYYPTSRHQLSVSFYIINHHKT